MKSFFVITFLFFSKVFAATPQFIELRTNKASYTVGEKVVLMASVKTSPTDPDSEVFVTGTWGAAPIKLVKFSDFESAAVTPPLVSPGQMVFHVDAYLQNKQLAKNILTSVASLEQESIKLNNLLSKETIPAKKANLQQAIDNNSQLRQDLLSQLSSHRTLVESKDVTVTVAAALLEKKLVSGLSLIPDHLNYTYSLGQNANIAASVDAAALGYDIKEIDLFLTAKINANPLIATPTNPSSFNISISSANLSLGSHEVTASLTVRNKRDGKSLNDAISAGFLYKSEMIQERNKATDPNLIAYYQSEIDDLDLIIAAFSDVLDNLKIFIGDTLITIKVEAPSIILSKDYIEIYEGSRSFYNVSLVAQPSSSVTVVAASPTADVTLSNTDGPPWANTATLTFTTSNWNIPQKVSIRTLEDFLADGDAVHSITHTVSGGGIASGQYMPVRVSLKDNGATPLVWDSISMNNQSACATRGGALYCWGNNLNGQLGVGDKDDRNVPTPVKGMTTNVQSVSVGQNSTCAVKQSELYCWGSNYQGQIGQGMAGGEYPIPTKVNLNNVLSVAVGDSTACAITNNTFLNPPEKMLFCWGWNAGGQLGLGDKAARSAPALVSVSKPKQVSVGYLHTCAVTETGSPYCWGNNSLYKLGNGLTTESLTPVLANQFTNGSVSKIVAGHENTCVLENGAVRCVGANTYGQLGDPNYIGGSSASPITAVGLSSLVTDVELAKSSIAAIKGGLVYYWGFVAVPAAGIPSSLKTPTIMSGVENVTSIDSEQNGQCAIGEGKAFCWGFGTKGMLGNGQNQNSDSPVEVNRPNSLLRNTTKF
ncbi:MAG: hypothetical protein OM95_10655 [Bdellovibrio sp. ArHS]|uniref:RCC1 domain-containing protein n=1 Tax=Bdellovibrio sp. ArHS TaxID=1569284 RepID=UPI000583DEFB|nr:hypothetical protein [Bdellovibrio sp. ArHS]KHD87984.1 MAG: hypothetical protein OM95_10655 [Bdellovibrio sp. ArHS]